MKYLTVFNVNLLFFSVSSYFVPLSSWRYCTKIEIKLTLFILTLNVHKIHHIQSNEFFPQVLQSTQIKTMEECLCGLHITVSQMPNVSLLKLNVYVNRDLSTNWKCNLYLFWVTWILIRKQFVFVLFCFLMEVVILECFSFWKIVGWSFQFVSGPEDWKYLGSDGIAA